MNGRAAYFFAYLVIVVALVSIALRLLCDIALMMDVWDDGYMWVRYAHNILAHGQVAWNGSTPTYGLTSQAMLLFSVPLMAIFDDPIFVGGAAGLIGAVLFLASLPWLISSALPSASKLVRLVALGTVYSCIALACAQFSGLALSGMDTMTSLFFLSLYLIFILHISQRIGSVPIPQLIALGMYGGFLYLVRPDIMLFSVGIPFVLVVLTQNQAARRQALIILAATVVSLIAILELLWLYYGTPVPLPFFAKGTGINEATLWQILKFTPYIQFIAFVDTYKYCFAAFAAAAFVGWRHIYKGGPNAIRVALFLTACASMGYFLFFVLQVMGYDSRFYYSSLPVLLIFTGIAVSWILENIPSEIAEKTSIVLCVILVASLMTPLGSNAQQFGYIAIKKPHFLTKLWTSDPEVWKALYGEGAHSLFPCYDVVAELPQSVSVATTEVGKASMANNERYILDLAGLNSQEIAFGKSVGEAIEAHKIDVVLLPTEQYYPEFLKDILSSAAFKNGTYEMFRRGNPHIGDIAVRKSGIYAGEVTKCLRDLGLSDQPQKDTMQQHTDQFYYLSLPYPLRTIN